MRKPCSLRYVSAATSPAWPTRSLRGRAGGSCSGVLDPRLRSAVALGGCDCNLGFVGLVGPLGGLGIACRQVAGRLVHLVLVDVGIGHRLRLGAEQGHLGTADRLTPLANAGVTADLLAQVEQLCPAHLAVAQHLDLVDSRSVDKECPLDADTVGDAADGEAGGEPD